MRINETWKCEALTNFLVIDHLGRVGGCHSHSFAGSIFDLPKSWKSQGFKSFEKPITNATVAIIYVIFSILSKEARVGIFL